MLKGGVIMDVVTAEHARIAETAGACAVMALERVPSDIRVQGGVARPVSRVGVNTKLEGDLDNVQRDPMVFGLTIGDAGRVDLIEGALPAVGRRGAGLSSWGDRCNQGRRAIPAGPERIGAIGREHTHDLDFGEPGGKPEGRGSNPGFAQRKILA